MTFVNTAIQYQVDFLTRSAENCLKKSQLLKLSYTVSDFFDPKELKKILIFGILCTRFPINPIS